MPWNEPGGNKQDPWTGKKRSSGSSDPEEMIRKLNQKLNSLFGGGGGDGGGSTGNSAKGVIILAVILLVGWLLSGFYTVDARQQGLVLRFGEYQKTTDAGLHWRLPTPIEKVEILDVEQIRTAEDRNTMLTKDENIVDIAVSVQYKISDAQAYAFNVLKPDDLQNQMTGTIYQVMRSSTRGVIGRNDMDFILREGREQIALDVEQIMQRVLDGYKTGLQIIKVNLTYAEAPTEVKDAFDEANRAREDANRFRNEAETYSNRVLPEARGKAARLLEEANAYKEQVIARSEGDSARFVQLAAEYRNAPEITRERLYLDTMESVMSGTRKIMLDTSNSNNMMYLPLDQLNAGSGGNASSSSVNAAGTAAAMQDLLNNNNQQNASSNTRLSRESSRESR